MNFLFYVLSLILVFVSPGSLSSQSDCWKSGTYHFVINQIDAPPTEIYLELENGTEVVAPLTKYNNNIAQYEYPYEGIALENASAYVPENWNGQFVLGCALPTGIGLTDFSAESGAKINRDLLFLIIILLVFILFYLISRD